MGPPLPIPTAFALGAVQVCHIDHQELERYFLGTVNEPRLTRVEEHLLYCAICVARVKEIGRDINELNVAEDTHD